MITLWIFFGIGMLLLNLGCIGVIIEMIKDRIIVGTIAVGMLEITWLLLTYLFIKYILLSYGVIL